MWYSVQRLMQLVIELPIAGGGDWQTNQDVTVAPCAMRGCYSATLVIALNEFVAANRTLANSHFRP
jgi:hypothetical protein